MSVPKVITSGQPIETLDTEMRRKRKKGRREREETEKVKES